MIPLAAGALAGTRLLSGDPATRIESVVTDSRAAGPGALFCALEGSAPTGTTSSTPCRRRARSRCCAAAAARDRSTGVCVLEADDPLTALGAIARQVRRAWGGKVIGIAGSNGKTSTKDMLAALCAPHVPTLATHRNHNNRLGLPLTLFRLEPEHELCICELGTSEVGELADLAAIAEPEIGVITNIAPEHLEFLGDLEGVAREEAALLAALPAERRRRAARRRAAARALPARGRAHDDVRRAGRRRPLPRLGAGRGRHARAARRARSAGDLTCRCARRITPRISRPRPRPTSAPGCHWKGSPRARPTSSSRPTAGRSRSGAAAACS